MKRAMLLVAAISCLTSIASAKLSKPPRPAVLPTGVVSATAKVGDANICYLRAGRGPALLLLPGFPEDRTAWLPVMTRLAARYTVIAPDLRGVGCSSAPAARYDYPTMAEDALALTRALNLDQPYVVGHDIGGLIAYTLARLHPEAIRGAMLVEAPILGAPSWEAAKAPFWHVGFHQTPDLSEAMIAGKQQIYFGYFLKSATARRGVIGDAQIARYCLAYQRPAQIHAMMEMYRAMPAAARFNTSHTGPTDEPLTLVWGETSFAKMGEKMAGDARSWGWSNVRNRVIAAAGHYPADEQPAALVSEIELAAGQ